MQKIGLPMLTALMVGLALLLADGGRLEQETSRDGVVVKLAYDARPRYGKATLLRIDVRPAAGGVLEAGRVRVDADWLGHFSQLAPQPSPTVVVDGALEFALPAGVRAAHVLLEMVPENYGRARGRVEIEPRPGTRFALPLDCLILP